MLPIELVIEILSRLAVKSLLRFKSVCKTWYALIETPNFIAKHLTQVTLDSNFNSKALLLLTVREALNWSVFDGLVNLNFPGVNTRDVLCFSGVCNGLVCLQFYESPLILCNPATRQFQEILYNNWWDDPDGKNIWETFGYIWETFGFGFHPNAGDYVVVRIMCLITGDGKHIVRTDLYMMGTDTWRELDVTMPYAFDEEVDNANFRPCALGGPPAVFLNGRFYWPAEAFPSHNIILVSLDLGDEVFRKIRTPFCYPIGGGMSTEWSLEGLKDKLAMVIYPYSEKECLDVWVLNKDQRSWTKQFRVGPFSLTSDPLGYVLLFVGCAQNGELILAVDIQGWVKLYICDVKTQVIKDLPFDKDPCPSRRFVHDIFMYVETLVQVKNET